MSHFDLESARGANYKKYGIPYKCESISHLPLWGRCFAPSINFNHNLLKQGTGAADHPTLLRFS